MPATKASRRRQRRQKCTGRKRRLDCDRMSSCVSQGGKPARAPTPRAVAFSRPRLTTSKVNLAGKPPMGLVWPKIRQGCSEVCWNTFLIVCKQRELHTGHNVARAALEANAASTVTAMSSRASQGGKPSRLRPLRCSKSARRLASYFRGPFSQSTTPAWHCAWVRVSMYWRDVTHRLSTACVKASGVVCQRTALR